MYAEQIFAFMPYFLKLLEACHQFINFTNKLKFYGYVISVLTRMALAYVIGWQAVEFGVNNKSSVIKSLFGTVMLPLFTQCKKYLPHCTV